MTPRERRRWNAEARWLQQQPLRVQVLYLRELGRNGERQPVTRESAPDAPGPVPHRASLWKRGKFSKLTQDPRGR
jgi:hypothetical protein